MMTDYWENENMGRKKTLLQRKGTKVIILYFFPFREADAND
jgi:hypothetical protein